MWIIVILYYNFNVAFAMENDIAKTIKDTVMLYAFPHSQTVFDNNPTLSKLYFNKTARCALLIYIAYTVDINSPDFAYTACKKASAAFYDYNLHNYSEFIEYEWIKGLKHGN